MKFRYYKYFTIYLLLLLSLTANSQFYNGHQMEFGKNRVQFNEFEWFYYRFQKFDTYFYAGGTQIAKQTAEMAYEEIDNLSRQMDYQLNKRLIFVIYHSLSDFRQSNIGLKTLDNQYNIGGETRIVDNIIFMYVEGDKASLRAQLRASITEITLNEILYGSDWKNKAANNTLLNLPEWYTKGLISHIAHGWNENIENHVRDGIINGYYEKFNQLKGEDAIYAGHSIWHYISNTYGDQVIPTILYLTKTSKNLESGFMYVLGTNLKSLSFSWLNYYDKLLYDQYQSRDATSGNEILKRIKKDRKYQQAKISPDGKYIAYTTNIIGKMKIFIQDQESGKTKKILRQGHKLDQITDYSYPVLRWHPSGKLLGYITEQQGGIYYYAYNIEDKTQRKIELNGFEKVLSFDYSNDGFDIVFSGYKNGQSDIYIYNLASNTYRNLTADKADDYHPIYIKNSNQILFSSKRAIDSLEDKDDSLIPTQKNRDIFLYDLNATKNELTQLTKTADTDEKQAFFTDDEHYIYLSNKNGIYNRFAAKYDSTISNIDTITHYRYFMRSFPLTNYKMNIQEHNFASNTDLYTEVYFENNRHKIYKDELVAEPVTDELKNTIYRKAYLDDFHNPKPEPETETKPENAHQDSLINIDAYKFSPTLLSLSGTESDFDEDGNLKRRNLNRYSTSFYTTKIVNQVDFGFLNASYQRFTGSAFYFNPGFNILLTVEAMDLFEDYRLTGGFRFAGNFDSNEYLFSFEDLKSRWNKQYIFHRQSITNFSGNALYKTYLHQGVHRIRYPFNQVSAVQGSLSLRQDKSVFLSTDFQNLLQENEYDYWAGLKLEYIFDNTRNLSLNILDGLRFKAFGEFYKQIDEKQTELFVVGWDLRSYIPIHRNLIFASRFAASSSFGTAKLIYYLGGVDNWINLNAERPMFDQSTRINPNENYVYQAVATNMRGFTQNIRNGNSFAVVNTEIRWPIINYLFNRPLNSEFLNNFQVIGFFDIGSAWTGLHPFSGDNAYENDYYENGPVTVIINNESYPIVAGYGIGVRTKLLGYFIRLDYARGIEDNTILPGMLYLSLNLDF